VTWTLGQIVGRTPKRGCDGKQPHRSKGAAEAAIRARKRSPNYKPSAVALAPYKCRYCDWWHVGHDARQ
jgi:hypothetical protein